MTTGALFAGNYFGGEVADEAEKLFQSVNWMKAVPSADTAHVWSTVDEDGTFGHGYTHPLITR